MSTQQNCCVEMGVLEPVVLLMLGVTMGLTVEGVMLDTMVVLVWVVMEVCPVAGVVPVVVVVTVTGGDVGVELGLVVGAEDTGVVVLLEVVPGVPGGVLPGVDGGMLDVPGVMGLVVAEDPGGVWVVVSSSEGIVPVEVSR